MHKLPQARKDYVNAWAAALRQKVLAAFGSRCEKCGFDDWRALQIDHVRSNGYVERKKLKTLGLYRRVLGMTERERKQEYQLLCANCNVIKKYVRNEVRGRNGISNLSPAKRIGRWVRVGRWNSRGPKKIQTTEAPLSQGKMAGSQT